MNQTTSYQTVCLDLYINMNQTGSYHTVCLDLYINMIMRTAKFNNIYALVCV